MIALLAYLSITQDAAVSSDVSAALAEVRAALQAEREAIAVMSVEHSVELDRLRGEVGRRTDEFVDLTLGIADLERKVEGLRIERASLREACDAAAADLQRASDSALNAHPWLADLVDALPPSVHREEQLVALDLVEPDTDIVEAVSRIFHSGRLLLDEATTIELSQHTVRAPDGVARDAMLLRAGLLLTAYRTADETGVAVGAPAGVEGHRWRTSLSPEQMHSLDRAFDVLGGGSVPVPIHLPVDVSGQLPIEPRSSGLWQVALSGGPILVPLAVIALFAAFLILERVAYLVRQERGAEEFVTTMIAHCREGAFEEAAELASAQKSALQRTLGACLEHRGESRESMDEAAEEKIIRELPGLEGSIPIIGVLAAVAPMLGLLGTVVGMMRTFDTISLVGNGEPSVMAGGIYEALVTTMAGLIVAIPLLLAHGVLSARVDRFIGELEVHAANLVRVLQGDTRVAE